MDYRDSQINAELSNASERMLSPEEIVERAAKWIATPEAAEEMRRALADAEAASKAFTEACRVTHEQMSFRVTI